jgi:hypothetical protein
MPAPFTEEHWALLAQEYVELARQSGVYFPNALWAQREGIDKKVIGTRVFRMRRYGYLEPFVSRSEAPRLTQKSLDILAKRKRKQKVMVAFKMEVVADSKAEALAEAWDLVTQLEHWDDRSGEPFQYKPGRIRGLGEKNETNQGESGADGNDES